MFGKNYMDYHSLELVYLRQAKDTPGGVAKGIKTEYNIIKQSQYQYTLCSHSCHHFITIPRGKRTRFMRNLSEL